MSESLDWNRDGRQWPLHEASFFAHAGGLRWHVQRMGAGPVVMLIHGTGASTHSWRDLMPRLARDFTVIAMDLPGHAFTGTPSRSQLSLPGMAHLLEALIREMAIEVDTIVGHSAGAAIAARLVLDGRHAVRTIVSINGAFFPMGGLAGKIFPPVARLMAATPFAPQLFARRTWDRSAVERLIAGTGSTLDTTGLELYGRLMRDPRHAAGALGMMAHWDLHPLIRDLARLRTPLGLIVGSGDRAVPPADARRVRSLLPSLTPCRIDTLPGGHLIHEERPAQVLSLLLEAMRTPSEVVQG